MYLQYKMNGTEVTNVLAGERTVPGLCDNGYDTYVTVIEESTRRRKRDVDDSAPILADYVCTDKTSYAIYFTIIYSIG